MILTTTLFGVATGYALLSSPKNHPGDAPRQAVLGDQARTLEASNSFHVPAYMPAAHVGGAPEAFLRGGRVGNAVGPGVVVAFAVVNRAGA